MDELLIEKIRDDFDRIALHEQQRWDHNNHYFSFLLNQLPSSGQKALEIGCGTGEFSRVLADRGWEVCAIDLSPNMIEIARSQSSPNIDFQVADVLKWKFPIEQFDAIVSIATLHHVPLELLLPKIKAALKPSGKLVILDLVEPEGVDRLIDIVAVPVNWVYENLKNREIERSREAIEAMREHLRTDQYLTSSQAKKMYSRFLKNVRIRRHLFWRYSAVWTK
ncbi:class I SAM-dependent methyltransferase [Leptolyngbya sp. AN03gr2]|uniref:class I SAM-dependent methyltransferase n=1 Tax=unclassified Leptolyngbya TaxID=2650499 RepID=UPI003D30FBC0